MKYKYDAFISYSSLDREHASRLFDTLQALNFKCWQDVHEIEAGEIFTDEIDNGLKSSRYLIVWLSENSIQSDWVRYEVNFMYSREKRDNQLTIIPAKGSDYVLPSSLTALKSRHYANFQDSFEEGLGAVLKILNGNSSVMINDLVSMIQKGQNVQLATERLGDLIQRTRDEDTFYLLWELAKDQPRSLIVDCCAKSIWKAVINTNDSQLEDLFFDMVGKSLKSKSNLLIDKFAYAVGQVALLSANPITRNRANDFIKRRLKSKNAFIQEKYNYTLTRIAEEV